MMTTMKTTCTWLIAMALTISTASLRSEDLLDHVLNDKPPPAPTSTTKPAEPPPPTPIRPNMPDLISPDAAKQLDDQDLLNKLTGQSNTGAESGGGGGTAAKMNQIMERMGQSQERLSKEKDTGLTTQEVQSRIMVDIDGIIELLKKQQSQSQSQGKGQPKEGDQRQQSQQQGLQQTQDNQAATESRLPGGGISNPGGPDAEMREGRLTWGELPAKDRDLVANGAKEKFLPEYEDMIKHYYEALAELGKSDKSDKE
ncbi:MAG: hypothetical protein FWD61_00725 [Phycisphaerales bacterium]|nr:hypothetical protein [Phycisphaerales bacterium]